MGKRRERKNERNEGKNMNTSSAKIELNGVHHLALVCKDMARTVDFYTSVLGLRLKKGFDLPGYGQHFFFDMGNGSELAFFLGLDWRSGAYCVALRMLGAMCSFRSA